MGKRNSKAYPERHTRTEFFPKADIQGERSEPSISGILHPKGKRFPQGDKNAAGRMDSQSEYRQDTGKRKCSGSEHGKEKTKDRQNVSIRRNAPFTL